MENGVDLSSGSAELHGTGDHGVLVPAMLLVFFPDLF
jgi:hypothetical protein